MLDLNRGKPLVLVYCVNVARFLAVMHRKWTRRLARKLSSSTHEPFKWLKFFALSFLCCCYQKNEACFGQYISSTSLSICWPIRCIHVSNWSVMSLKICRYSWKFCQKILAIVLLYPTESKKIPLYFKKWIIYPPGRSVQPIISIVWQNSEENCYLPVVCHTTLSNVLLTMKLK